MNSRTDISREALQLAAIVESSEDAIVSKDLNGIVQSWNPSAERIFGYSAREMIGRSILTIIPPERHGEEDLVLGRVRAGLSVDHFETVRRRKDGTYIDVSLSVSPIRTHDGEIIGASKIARDITLKKRLERDALRLAAIVDAAEDAIVSKDLTGVVQTWNRAAERMFGYSADEIVGKPIRIIIPADRQSEEDEVLSRIRAGHAIEHFETVRQRKDGSSVEVSLSVSPVKAADGSVIGASKIARDISVQRQLTRAAEEANRVKDEFLATLSHELRTPLNAVVGYIRMLRSGQVSADGTTRAIEVVERNVTRLSQLVSEVLDVSNIVTGRIRLAPSRCDLSSILNDAIDVISPSANAKGVALHLAPIGGPVPVWCDADRILQVLWNVLTNAVKFTPRGGAIDIKLDASDDAARVTVQDSGEGIAPEALPRVFQRFWQADSVRSHPVSGLGLGLALARHFMELHGGRITVQSEGLGKGATFTIELPIAAPDIAQPASR